MLLASEGLKVDLVFADLNFRNIRFGIIGKKRKNTINGSFREFITQGVLPPKNTSLVLNIWLRAFETLISEYIQEHGRPSLIYAQTYLGGVVASRIQKKYAIPFVVTLHYSGFIDNRIRASHLALCRAHLKTASAVICVSHAMSQRVAQLLNLKTTTIHNFIDPLLFVPGKEKASAFQLIFIGDLIPRKQPLLLINAFKLVKSKIPSAQLIIVGDGSLRRKCRRLVRSYGLTGQVIFKGRVPQKELAEILSLAHLLILPSLCESFGLVLAEAMSCGIPVISSNHSGAADIIIEGSGHIIDHPSASTLADSIVDVFTNYHKYDQQFIRNHIINTFSAKAILPQLMSLFHDITDPS